MTKLPTHMHVLEVSELAPDLAGVGIAERPVPQPGAGQALVRIEAASLGFPDLLMTEGLYQAKPPLPFVPGMEAAGEVVAAGEGSRWQAGDKVIVATLTGAVQQYGAYADAALVPLPAALSYAEGASLRAAYITAYTAIARIGRAEAGETLVVHGAAGGVGLAAVDLGKALGLSVIAASSTPEKREAISRLYAPDHILAGPTGLREQILELTGGRGADLVYDPVGGDVFDEACRYTAFGGRLLVVGFAGGRIAEVRTNIPLIKGFSVVGVRAGEYGRRFPERGREDMAAVMRLAAEGRIRPHVHSAVPLVDWREAYLAMRERRVIGRTVILPNG
ncbi:NADPH:quinone oxidoreductase [Novosphingobium sediminis]|uniref:NADPH:quinone oxidoreductase n=1 Tax=Novosphingobium sediminis TaxID=707214 RepID=A0A512AJH4_9SPHN|nr:NADPH:quinone oxidoreductase family protein [Novosphingobium sediminis]GEN99848.1 NADPH:quinone oxidoreductase [Novosphingobium sediminis]